MNTARELRGEIKKAIAGRVGSHAPAAHQKNTFFVLFFIYFN